MRDRFDNLIDSLETLRDLVRNPLGQLVPAGLGVILAEPEDLWEVSRRQMDEVLITTSDHSQLVNRLRNGRMYHTFGERSLAEWELNQAIRLAKLLQRLYA